MFRNYLLIALRNLARHKLYSFINIAGLAIGLACAIFIVLFTRDELSYDSWLAGTHNLYRMELTINVPGRPPQDFATIAFPMPKAMHDEIPEVTAFTRLNSEQMTITAGKRQFFESIQVADPNFFRLIQLAFLKGDPATALAQPESLVLSETAARKYFGDADPIGKLVTVGKAGCDDVDEACRAANVSLMVTGVFKDVPHNSQLLVNAVIPNTSSVDRAGEDEKTEWLNNNYYGYLQLAPGAAPQTVLEKLQPILDRAMHSKLEAAGVAQKGSQVYQVHLTPFREVHLASSRYASNATPPGSWTTIYGVIAIGVLIMLVACINFMNLATARAMLRAREIALRKTLGAKRQQLIVQFLGESVLLALIALLLALSMVEILLPAFDTFLQRPIAFHYFADWQLLLLTLGFAVLAGLVSGSYPALVLSSFRPASVLRANSSSQAGSGRLRTALVIMQFSVSIGLGIAALIVFGQISYARKVDLGFRRDQIVVMNVGRLTQDGRESFTHLLRAHAGVLDTALSNDVPFTSNQALDVVQVPGQPGIILLNQVVIDQDFAHLYGISLVTGRMIEANRANDYLTPGLDKPNEGRNVLINEAAAARLGFSPAQAAGKTIVFNNSHVQIVGVLGDIKFRGAREPVKPTVYFNSKVATYLMSIRVSSQGMKDTLAFIDQTWHSLAANDAPQRSFLDENFNQLYQVEERQGTMFGIFVGIAVLIACLGLFGLAAFTAGRRTREIGVRKAFGARTRDVALLLLWQVSIPVLIANVIAWPVDWYYLHGWLQGFAYRISLNPIYFLGAGMAALAIAWATILVHALRVSRANPIHALRYE